MAETQIAEELRAPAIARVGSDPIFTDERLHDFRVFQYLVWRHLGLPDPTGLQYDMARFCQTGGARDESRRPRRRFLTAFRGAAKSYDAGAYMAWRIGWNPKINGMFVSASGDKAGQLSTFVMLLIETMPVLAPLIPDAAKRWSKLEFDVAGAEIASQNATCRARGIFGTMTGGRSHLTIVDDIETPKTAETQHQKERLTERSKELESIMHPGGEIVYLGTFQDEDSIYLKLREQGYVQRLWPARYPSDLLVERYGENMDGGSVVAPSILGGVEGGLKEAGAPTEPTRFGNEELEEREAAIGRSTFALQFLLDTTLADVGKFPLKLGDLIVMDLDHGAGPERPVWASSRELAWPQLGPNGVPNVGFRGDRYYRPMALLGGVAPYNGAVMFIDPSGKGQDETGYAVVKHLNGYQFCTALGGLIGGYEDPEMEHLARTAVDQGVNRIIVEQNFGGGMFAKLLVPALRRAGSTPQMVRRGDFAHGIGIEEVHSTGQKERRIIDTLEPLMNQHRLVVDVKVIREDFEGVPKDAEGGGTAYQGFRQLSRLTRAQGSLLHDDRVEALAGACRYWVDQAAMIAEEQIDRRRTEALQAEFRRYKDHALRGVDAPAATPGGGVPNWNGRILRSRPRPRAARR